MIKKIVLILPLALSLNAQAGNVRLLDSLVVHNASLEMLEPIEPSYLENITSARIWNGNWFLGISSGASAFVGSPLGCADLFDRIEPALSVSGGKWFTPAIGGRVSFQGFKLKTACCIPNHTKVYMLIFYGMYCLTITISVTSPNGRLFPMQDLASYITRIMGTVLLPSLMA